MEKQDHKESPMLKHRKDLPKTEIEAGQQRINTHSLSQGKQELRNKEQRLAMEEREQVGRSMTFRPIGRALQ